MAIRLARNLAAIKDSNCTGAPIYMSVRGFYLAQAGFLFPLSACLFINQIHDGPTEWFHLQLDDFVLPVRPGGTLLGGIVALVLCPSVELQTIYSAIEMEMEWRGKEIGKVEVKWKLVDWNRKGE